MRTEPHDQFETEEDFGDAITRLRAFRLVVLLYLVIVCLIGANI
ncbi:MAG: hypothetical protein RIS45_1563 [Planctomycetota bacterium]|jgi:hypothetical protein